MTQQVRCDSPVLLIVWNRPDETRRAIEAIRVVEPRLLFVAGDGPRSPEEASRVDEVRRLVNDLVDWPCDLVTNYSAENLGCRAGVTRAIDWFFTQVDEGIVLEDDCIAGADFFAFCDEMLQRFRSDHRVMHIAGDNSARVRIAQDWSYCFVRYPHIWGWATWKRAWANYDRDMMEWDSFRRSGQLVDVFANDDERETWVPVFNRLFDAGEPDTWDWQWAATCMMRDALCVQPTVNLISNIGFNDRGTHTTRPSDRSDMPAQSLFPLRHPPAVYRHRDAERQIFLNTQAGLRAKPKGRAWMRVLRRIKFWILNTQAVAVLRRSFRFTSRD